MKAVSSLDINANMLARIINLLNQGTLCIIIEILLLSNHRWLPKRQETQSRHYWWTLGWVGLKFALQIIANQDLKTTLTSEIRILNPISVHCNDANIVAGEPHSVGRAVGIIESLPCWMETPADLDHKWGSRQMHRKKNVLLLYTVPLHLFSQSLFPFIFCLRANMQNVKKLLCEYSASTLNPQLTLNILAWVTDSE